MTRSKKLKKLYPADRLQPKLNPSDHLPPEIFVDIIMFNVGSQSLKSLKTCRLVCKDWKKKIRDSLWENPSKKWGPIIGRRFEASWEIALPSEEILSKATELVTQGILPSAVMERLAKKLKGFLAGGTNDISSVTCAASLARKRLLGPVEEMKLWDVDLTSVPAEHLVSLVSSVRGWCVFIEKVSGCDLVTLLDSVKSQLLSISYQSLGHEETEALMRAMESRVEQVRLADVTLDSEAFTKYSGRGKCKEVWCFSENAANYRGQRQVRSWARNKGWKVRASGENLFMNRT